MEQALESFFRERSWLRQVARGLVRDENDAEDLVQETWAAALRNPPPDQGDPRRWLRAVARRLAKRRRLITVDEEVLDAHLAEEPLTDEVVARWEASTLLQQAIEGLPERERAAILLRFQEGRTCEEAAAELGVHPRTVRLRIAAAKHSLRQSLGRDLDGVTRLPGWLAALLPLLEEAELVTIAGRFGASVGKLTLSTALLRTLAIVILSLTGTLWAGWRLAHPRPALAPTAPALLAPELAGAAAGSLEGLADPEVAPGLRAAPEREATTELAAGTLPVAQTIPLPDARRVLLRVGLGDRVPAAYEAFLRPVDEAGPRQAGPDARGALPAGGEVVLQIRATRAELIVRPQLDGSGADAWPTFRREVDLAYGPGPLRVELDVPTTRSTRAAPADAEGLRLAGRAGDWTWTADARVAGGRATFPCVPLGAADLSALPEGTVLRTVAIGGD